MADDTKAYNGPIVTLAEARKNGAKRFFTGLPCSHGHIAERFVSSKGCMTCSYARRAQYKSQWRANNWDQFLAWQTIYRRENPEKIKAWAASADPKKRNATTAKRKMAKPEVFRVYKTNRRAREQQASGKHSASDIVALLKRQNRKCAHPWCRKSLSSGYHIDHILPLSGGGANDRHNLQLLCRYCNLSKSDTHPIEYAMKHGFLV